MREILFRGKSKKSNTWAYGYFVESEGVCFIYSKNENLRWMVHEVIPESVGQFTGLISNAGIYENDYVSFGNQIQIIKYRQEICGFERISPQGPAVLSSKTADLITVIGNTTDNPDLIPEE